MSSIKHYYQQQSWLIHMTDVLTKAQRKYNMSMIKSKNTKPEIKLRKYLWSNGLRGYRIHPKLKGKPDIVYTKHKLVIFIDGCFWHKCPKCFKLPKSNVAFWQNKINENVIRDKKTKIVLKKEGWIVLRFWEHEVEKDVEKVYTRIKSAIKGYEV